MVQLIVTEGPKQKYVGYVLLVAFFFLFSDGYVFVLRKWAKEDPCYPESKRKFHEAVKEKRGSYPPSL